MKRNVSFTIQNEMQLKQTGISVGKFSKEQGFTLIELVITIVLIGILASIAAVRYNDLSEQSKTTACTSNQASIELAQTFYYANSMLSGTGQFANDLATLMPYLNKTPECPDEGSYNLLSTGEVTCTFSSHNL